MGFLQTLLYVTRIISQIYNIMYFLLQELIHKFTTSSTLCYSNSFTHVHHHVLYVTIIKLQIYIIMYFMLQELNFKFNTVKTLCYKN